MRKPGILDPDGPGEPDEPVRSALVGAQSYRRAEQFFGTALAFILTLHRMLFKWISYRISPESPGVLEGASVRF